jgi:hypothetical protein
MPMAEYATLSEIAEQNQVYWREILFRAHFGASTGMLRLNEWLHGSERALVDRNVLMLAAGIRGFLEACADTWQGFSSVAPTLADCHTLVRRAIKGELSEQLALAPELENALIHFSYARKLRPGEGPALHSAATARECLSVLSEAVPDLVDVYHALCEYTHPAMSSLFRFGSESSHSDTLTFDPKLGPDKLGKIVALSEHVGKMALVLAAGPLITTLKILNAFAFAEVATPWADSVNLGFSSVWRELQSRISSQVGPKTASDEQRDELIAELNAQYLSFGKSKRPKEH